MPPEHQEPPQYTRYRARRRLIPGATGASARSGSAPRSHRGRGTPLRERWRQWATVKRVLLVLGGRSSRGVALSVLLF
jgi:hypothetical protein